MPIKSAGKDVPGYPPLADLFSIEQLEKHGQFLARLHELELRPGTDKLLERLTYNEKKLIEVCDSLDAGEYSRQSMSSAEIWLLDNFYLIKEQIKVARNHFPKQYSRKLPRLASGPLAGFPRIFDIISELIAHVDGRVDEGTLRAIISSYQDITSLTTGELWAIPIMLRLALIDNIRGIAGRVDANRRDYDCAAFWAQRMITKAAEDPKNIVLDLADMVREKIFLSPAFVTEFEKRLQNQHPASTLPLAWIEQRLAEMGETTERLISQDNQHQAVDQISISNSITGLRILQAISWKDFVEDMSRVNKILCKDPAGVYPNMDFATRDMYRHVIEKIASQSRREEGFVAETAIALAKEKGAPHQRLAHVGCYLIGRERKVLEKTVRARRRMKDRLGTLGGRVPLFFYIAPAVVLTFGIAAVLLCLTYFKGRSLELTGLLSILCLLVSSHPAIALVNWAAGFFIAPRLLPRMNFRERIPDESTTLVTVPAMLSSEAVIRQLLNRLEICYLANKADNIYFSLVTDFKDASKEHMDDDDTLFDTAKEGIIELNNKYKQEAGPFFYFHRQREWNPVEKKWMGYERKRGKLEELNRTLRGTAKQNMVIVGDADIIRSVKYVITLDADTDLPRDAARLLIETMAHPLNRPEYDKAKHRITQGYTILQPRVVSSLPAARRSWYARIFGQDFGIDPYTRAVSDVYQDLFGEGSFIGKGIYDVDMFMATIGDRFPENRILSHDLLEGSYGRAGLVSDVQVVDDFPSSYSEDVSRRHRWIRGDWQIASWLLPRVPGYKSESLKNPVSVLSRWKIFDNLRRSLVSLGLLVFIIACWLLPVSPGLGIAIAAGVLLLPVLPATVKKALGIPERYPFSLHVISLAGSFGRHIFQSVFLFISLPFEAYYHLDAIFRTIWRMVFLKRKLLEWTTSGEAKNQTCVSFKSYCFRMLVVPLFVLVAIAAFLIMAREIPPDMWCVFGAWLLSPVLAWWTSRLIKEQKKKLIPAQLRFLRKISRKTWRFFETFVTARTNWLPPDNYQEEPKEMEADMTSPTNIGLMLLSNLGAYDQGYINAGQLIDKTRKTFRTLHSLERYNGHFFNWYEVESLAALSPKYISTVDSGNFAGYLFALQTGIRELSGNQVFQQNSWSALSDILLVLEDLCFSSQDIKPGKSAVPPEVRQRFSRLQNSVAERESYLTGLRESLADLKKYSKQLSEIQSVLTDTSSEEIVWWFTAFVGQCNALEEEMVFVAPWLALLDEIENTDQELSKTLDANVTLKTIAGLSDYMEEYGAALNKNQMRLSPDISERLMSKIRQGSHRAAERTAQLETMAVQAGELARHEYEFLFDHKRQLLSIGFNVDKHRLDDSFYDLLASEARLASFIGIARGLLPVEHWFSLGRQAMLWKGKTILLSWGGSMFEYLMPLLLLPGYETTLLDQSIRAVVEKQIAYGRIKKTPWGISESAENVTDVNLKYQYRSFGVPELGFKRGLSDDLVITPYATLMALMVMPEMACVNMQRLSALGFEGRFGFYEAIDYTQSRLPPQQTHVLIRSFMAHHQGISFISLLNYFKNNIMQKRFVSNPLFEATVLLLQEKVPKTSPFKAQPAEIERTRPLAEKKKEMFRVFDTPHTSFPEVHLLSNGRYHVMVTNAGGGYSRWNDIALTRWQEDATRDNHGTFVYINDLGGNNKWSAAFQPMCAGSKSYEAVFSQARAEFRRRDEGLDTYTEIAVSPEDDIEHRRVTLSNNTMRPRTVELTSYAEVVLVAPEAEAAHPVFSKLFVQTEIIPEQRAILCSRRPRSPDEHPPWMFHLLVVHENEKCEVSYETDRLRFLGRGRTAADPAALSTPGPLSGTSGNVLDPVVSIRCRLTIGPGETVSAGFIHGIAATREEAQRLIRKYSDRRLANRVFGIARIHGNVVLGQLGATEADAQLYGRLASGIVYTGVASRANPSVLLKNKKSQSALWAYSISGDLPIVLLKILDETNIELAARLIQAHEYWRSKGLSVDLVIWNEDRSGYRQIINDRLVSLIAASNEAAIFDKLGGIHIRQPDQMTDDDQILMQTVARLIFSDRAGSLEEQVQRQLSNKETGGKLRPIREKQPEADAENFKQEQLVFHNGWGGFTADGREYIIQVKNRRPTPLPWVNVIANKYFGTVVSTSGGYTWTENAHELRLTPWYNDPVSETSGEVLYIRDDETGAFWSATPLPAPGKNDYLNRQGFGYSVFEYVQQALKSELWTYVDIESPVKYWMVKLRNDSDRTRQVSLTLFCELVLGDQRSRTQMHVRTGIDGSTGMLYASNFYNQEFSSRIMFLESSERMRTVSGDRTEFLGRNGSHANPSGMQMTRLSGRVGCGLDPAAAIRVPFQLEPGQEKDVIFILGAGQNMDHARTLAQRHRTTLAAYRAREQVWEYWKHTLGAINVQTPDGALNMMSNGWLLYQTMSARLFARSGFYQSGGAIGFRDQLQDVMAVIHAQPEIIREHLLLAASRQFAEGDVQHWWHPPVGRGVRTMISDDYLWLAFVTAFYVRTTGDTGVLDESVPFLAGRKLNAGEESYYDLPFSTEEKASLFEHCKRAIMHGVRFGEHGLPLMGSGDWNDGMNLVGIEGRGESVWLGFFLHAVFECFAEVAQLYNDEQFAEHCVQEAKKLKDNLNVHAWDGEWYRRAYFDDNTPLGSKANKECCIDAIAQSWAVLSNAGTPERVKKALYSLDTMLIRRKEGIVLLLDPPFDKSNLEPGYIKGYVPGIRENGGQYTHAAVWAVMAYARIGDAEKVAELLSMINPVNHGSSPEKIGTYRVEPYVMAADIYSTFPHAGRGGWTWYTGSSAWMYRLIIENVFGIDKKGQTLSFHPCLPPQWKECTVHYRFRETVYHINYQQQQPGKVIRVLLDGKEHKEGVITLKDNRIDHAVKVIIGKKK
ncbi:MAG: cyclic beta 1-2 glucan synthetase [Spirochaetales bacterium]|nr:cyclic beta 1-2 glucan synthetase [Spirochaetales bacterium]